MVPTLLKISGESYAEKMENAMRMFVLNNMANAEEQLLQERRRFVVHNPFESLDEALFIKNFRLNKQLARYLIHVLDPFLIPPHRSSAVTKEMKVLITLSFVATGSYQTIVGNSLFCGGVSQSTVSRCVDEVITALNTPDIFNEWIKFPNTIGELEALRLRFFQKYDIPGIVGVIDCTHIAIFPPASNDEVNPEHMYVNRKNYHSLNVQLVCDLNLKIMNINSRFPGSTGDSHIWRNSALCQEMTNLHGRHPGFYLIGDSGYPHRPWLQIPIPGVQENTPEWRYNDSFKKARCLIERCNGLLKMRFRCLLKHRVLHYSPAKAAKIVHACSILHNMCIKYNIPDPLREDNEENLDLGIYDDNIGPLVDAAGVDPNLQKARRIQQRIVDIYTFFTDLYL